MLNQDLRLDIFSNNLNTVLPKNSDMLAIQFSKLGMNKFIDNITKNVIPIARIPILP